MDKASDFYRVATPEEISRMDIVQEVWYRTGLVPVFLMPDGEIRGQSCDGAFGGCRGAAACLVTQEWLDKNRAWLNRLDILAGDAAERAKNVR